MRKLNWGEDRVFYYDSAGALKSFMSNVTDLMTEDAFDHVSAGRVCISYGRSAGTPALLDKKNTSRNRTQDV